MSVLLERLVVAIEAMSTSVIRQKGHVYLAAELARQTTGAAAESGCMCMEYQLGAEFKPCWESWERWFKAEMSQMLWVIVVDSIEESDTRVDKGKGKEREVRVEEETLDVEDVEGKEDDEDKEIEIDIESDGESEEV
jgi:hypothetical protein